MLLNPNASFELAVRLRSERGAPLGEVFSFLSGLYFRGKLAYARAFGRRAHEAAAFVITTDRGFVAPDTHVHRDDLLSFSTVDLAVADERYIGPLSRDATRLAAEIEADAKVVLLGSIATGKYINTLTEILGERLVFPSDFVGRGDMSRGGLLLRCADDGRELAYEPVIGAVRHGKRPAKLERRQSRMVEGPRDVDRSLPETPV